MIEILKECKITPPQNSVETTKIPLTFFDILWVSVLPVERVLFYEFPHPTIYFTESILPQLKHSLSLALQHYFPLVGSLMCPPLPTAPYILYQNGDFIPLTIAESNSDFHHLIQNYPRSATDFCPLVPHLSNETSSLISRDDDQEPVKVLHPLIALQVTIFPHSGISICLTYRHVAGDGRTMTNFLKSWASLFKSNNVVSVIAQPLHDRTTINNDSNGLLSFLCKQLFESGVPWDNLTTATMSGVKLEDKLHATFVLGSREILLLRNWITSHFHGLDEPSPLPYVSAFVVTCAFIWVCFFKTKYIDAPTAGDDTSRNDDSVTHFGILADCTEKSELKVPKTYIGNCLTFGFASLTKSELMSEIGLLIAAKAIMQKIKELETGLLDKARRWLSYEADSFSPGSVIMVAGSPKLRAYETDFGWGNPKKSEMVHINKQVGTIALMESRDEKGAVEVGVSLNKIDMEAFTSIFELGLKNYMV